MHTYNILLALAGDRDNVIPKYEVTASEIALLQAIHGSEAVSDIEQVGTEKRSGREERNRLSDIYARVQANGTRVSQELEALFPGIAARLPETVDELEIDESQFKPTARANTKPAAKKAGKAKKDEKTDEPDGADEADENDGIGEIRDGVGNTVFE